LKMVPVNINEVVRAALLLVKHEFDQHRIEVIKELDETLPVLKIDKNKMEQVFINLLINAVQATERGGRIIVRSSLRLKSRNQDAFDDSPNPQANSLKDQAVLIEILDNGRGISDKIIDKIFDPFFTTKLSSGGTGLGLSIIRNIVDMHNGTIKIQNAPQGGVRASIVLPV